MEPSTVTDTPDLDRAARVLARARTIEAGQGIHRHHLVPESYLSRWTEDSKIRATVIDTGRTRLKAPKSVAYEEDFYRLEGEGLDNTEIPELTMEVLFGEIEQEAKPALDKLIHGQPLTPEERGYTAWVVALQFTRGKRFREQARLVADNIVELEYSGNSDAHIRRVLAERGEHPTPERMARGREFLDNLADGTLTFSPQDAAYTSMSGEYGSVIWPYLIRRQWCVYETPPILVTSDEPVVPLGGPAAPRDEIGSILEAPVVLLPLCPDRLLVLLRKDLKAEDRCELDHVETADVNKEMLASSYKWAFEKPSRSMTTRLLVPKAAAAIANNRIEGDNPSDREVWHMTRPSRWEAAPRTPWPVERWWRDWA